jgi:DNA-binding beta-propeller fold protein YncE
VHPTTGEVYVADTNNSLVQRFTASGVFLGQWAAAAPHGIAVHPITGDVFVAETGAHRVASYTASGTPITSWGKPGGGSGSLPGQFNYPTGVAVDPTPPGHIYVADQVNDRIQKFTLGGTHVTSWGTEGTGPGQFTSPHGVAVNTATREVLVADTYNHRIQKFNASGAHLATWGTTTYGSANGQFSHPHGVAVNPVNGQIYVADSYNNRMQKLSSSGAFLSAWGGVGLGHGEFYNPYGVGVVPSTGDVYVVDGYNYRIQRFADVSRTPRPDAKIRRPGGATVGNNIYNTTGSRQTTYGAARVGSSVTYTITAQNDAEFAEKLKLRGQGSTTQFRVVYRDPAGTNVTSAVAAGTYKTPPLAPNATHVVRATVTVRSNTVPGTTVSRTVTVTSNTDSSLSDTVKFVTSRSPT